MESSCPPLFPVEQWTSASFLVEIKPRTDFASLFVSCPKELTTSSSDVEPFGLIRLEEQMLELAIDPQKPSSSGSEEEHENEYLAIKKRKLSTKFSDILLDPATICSISWADQQQEILMCKVRAEADYVSFAPKTIKRLGEELVQMCHLPEYVERIERSKSFEVKCAQCGQQIHSHSKSDFEFGILPNDDWLELSPQLDYFCGQSGSECCAKQLEKDTAVQHHLHHNEGILGFSGGFSPESTRHWLPGERKIVFSNSFLLFHKNKALETALVENQVENCATILTCTKCQVQLGTALKGRPHILKLYMSVLDVHGDGRQRISYILSRFRSMECFLAWLLLNKCEHQASMKLLIRSLDRAPQLLVWLLEPYVLLTRGVLREAPEPGASPAGADTSSISFPALKILYKLFDADTSKQDPRANGGDSSVGILDVPMGCCLQFTETLLQSSLALPPPLRALGQFFVGFIQLKDRVD